jgi:carboxymethylenebutenolidase
MRTSTVARAAFVPLGGDLRGYYALPSGAGPVPAVLVYQEAFGVNDYIQSEVRRLAEHGFAALAPDLFRGKVFGYHELDQVMALLATLKDDALLSDVDASIAYLRGQSEIASGPLGAVGFCMGGRLAFLSATARAGEIGAAASFYGGSIAPVEAKRFPPLVDRVPELRGELLLFYGADDGSIEPSEHARLSEALSSAKKNYGLRVFADAGHGFASRDRDSFRPAAAAIAWDDTLRLFDRVLRAEPPGSSN